MSDPLEDFDHSAFTAQQREQDKALAVRFYKEALRNDHKSTLEGRPIYDQCEMVEIRVRGDRNNIVQRIATAEDKIRFRDAYRAWSDGTKAELSGTPLREWPVMSTSMVEELKYLGFFTVEQLAQANDASCSKVPGLLTMKNKAAAWIEFSKGGAPLERMQAQIDEERNKREAAENMNRALVQRLEAVEAQLHKNAASPSPAPVMPQSPDLSAAAQAPADSSQANSLSDMAAAEAEAAKPKTRGARAAA